MKIEVEVRGTLVEVLPGASTPAKVEIKTGSAPVGGGGGGGGTSVHNLLTGRDATDAHPISSITGLQAALDNEATAREAEDASLEAQITGEVTRAFTAEQDLQAQVDAEQAARVAALAAEAAQRAADIAAVASDLRGGAPADRDNLAELGALWAETDTDLAAAITALTGKANTDDVRFNPAPGALPDGTMVATESGLYVARTPAQVRAALNVANGATANSSDGYLLDRVNHTGTQAPSTITGTAVVTNDARLSDARTPTSHSHSIADLTDLPRARPFRPSSGLFIGPFGGIAHTTVSPSTTTLGSTQAVPLSPIDVGEDTLIDALAVYLSTPATDAGSTIELALGRINGGVWTMLFSAGTQAATGSARLLEFPYSTMVAAGPYFIATKFSSSTTAGTNPVLTGIRIAGDGLYTSTSMNSNNYQTKATLAGVSSTGSIPASQAVNITHTLNLDVPRAALRVA